MSSPVSASSGQGEMGVFILDPLQMPVTKAKIFCLSNDHTRKCQQLEREWVEKRRKRRRTSRKHKKHHNIHF